jgi:hypothetical protein
MAEDGADAAQFARRHAGEEEPDLTAAQRDLLGRILAKRIEQGSKMRLIERAAATGLPELGEERARRLARDETMRAFAHERLAILRRQGAVRVTISAAQDACDTCREHAQAYGIEQAPRLPIRGCTRPGGCRCLYSRADEGQ